MTKTVSRPNLVTTAVTREMKEVVAVDGDVEASEDVVVVEVTVEDTAEDSVDDQDSVVDAVRSVAAVEDLEVEVVAAEVRLAELKEERAAPNSEHQIFFKFEVCDHSSYSFASL